MMAYRFLDGIAMADVAFEATGENLAELFVAAGDATINTMIDSIDGILPKKSRKIQLRNGELDLLLFDFLQELIYYKDADGLLLRVSQVDIEEQGDEFRLAATGFGEEIDTARHEQGSDVKAVTLHQFVVEQTPQGWRCLVILDV
jgi:SHS2 domain-containing protein